MFGGQLSPMDRPGTIGASLSSEGIDLKKMHDAFLCPEGNPTAGHEQYQQCDAKAENEPLHILLLCRYGASSAKPATSGATASAPVRANARKGRKPFPGRPFTGYAEIH